MKVERTLRHPIPAAEGFRMLVTEEFQEQKCRDCGALDWSVAVHERSDDTIVVRTTRRMPTHDFPAILRKFVPNGVTTTETITWGPTGRDGGRSADLKVAFHGVPAKMAGTIRFRAVGDETEIAVKAEFSAHVPMLRKKIEAVSVPIILQVIDAEVLSAQAWVAGVH